MSQNDPDYEGDEYINLNANLFMQIFLEQYRQFTLKWLDLTEDRNPDDVYQLNYIYTDDIMYLPKKYQDCYKETREEEFKHGQPIVDDLIKLIHLLRKQMKMLSFDFFSCFFYDKERECFTPHKDEYKACVEEDDSKALQRMREPALSLLIGIGAEKLFEECLW